MEYKRYRFSKTAYKALKPPAFIGILTFVVYAILKENNIEIEMEKIGGVLLLIYGAFEGIINYIKNKIPN